MLSDAYIYGDRVIQARQIQRLRRVDCAKKLGIPTAQLREIEQGRNKPVKVSRQLALRLSMCLNFPEKWFYRKPINTKFEPDSIFWH